MMFSPDVKGQSAARSRRIASACARHIGATGFAAF
jgi:hypothetical protein